MIHISNLDGVDVLADDPELWREVYGYLSVCAAEFLEYADEKSLADHDFNFQVIDETYLPTLETLGTPEECIRIDILASNGTRRLYRIIYPTEVLFVPGELSDRLPFPLPAS